MGAAFVRGAGLRGIWVGHGTWPEHEHGAEHVVGHVAGHVLDGIAILAAASR
ncbi:hypothetical protein HD597_001522 [Nonomuraea thailandensis]|uniref:Uncharacterized protein n=1 Tax=Nonomuraea thailandensis TaxID=1188745 RepID=A0A9X2JYS2_9ACTN|nr:hypothetical protein [Nonomuraea thailandensis]MCP2354502.1 hypothetical protein [Nonomuraea thailandensis]